MEKVRDLPLLNKDFVFSTKSDHYLISFQRPVKMTGNAPFNGGQFIGKNFINRTVHKNYMDDPIPETKEFLGRNNYSSKETAVTLTAVNIREAKTKSENIEEFGFRIFLTAGIDNAISIGGFSPEQGTINICVLTDLPMTDSAAINAIQTIVESKAAALFEMDVRDKNTGKLAPGTSTDTVTIIRTSEYEDIPYCGRATPWGALLSELIYFSLMEVLQ